MPRMIAEPALRAALFAITSTNPSCRPPRGPVDPKIKAPRPPRLPLSAGEKPEFGGAATPPIGTVG